MDNLEQAKLKLQAYEAATRACSSSVNYAARAMSGGSGPTVSEIKAEAERLWAWMVEEPKVAESAAQDTISRMKTDSVTLIVNKPLLDVMVNRFLGWKLPANFSPDCFVRFDRDAASFNKSWPIGTNILDAEQARAMLRHVLGLNP